MLPAIWSRPIHRVTTRMVETFLEGQSAETLYWEAKADAPDPLPKAKIVRAVCAFANSRDGGYVIVGAKETSTGVFTLPGLTVTRLGRSSLVDWLDRIIEDGFQSLPKPFIQPLQGRTAAVIAVEPIENPPCVTKDGGVYIRTSGSSDPVTDQRELTRLFDEGRARKSREAISAVDALLNRAVILHNRLQLPLPDEDRDPLNAEFDEWIKDVSRTLEAHMAGLSAGFRSHSERRISYSTSLPDWQDLLLHRLRGRMDKLVATQHLMIGSIR